MRSIFFASWLCLATSAFHPPLLLLNVPKRPLVIRHASVRSHEKNDRFVRNPIHPSKHFRRQPRYDSNSKLKWIQQATDRFVTQNELGSLAEGKWHEVVSLVNAWSFFQKDEGQAPAQMEALLKVLVEERGAGNTAVELTIDLYNRLLDAWACAALFRTIEHPEKASQRAREILVMLQENYEHESCVSRRRNPAESCDVLKPNTESFNAVLHVVIRTEDILTARRLLAWMEYLHKSGKNVNAKPSRSAYIQILDAYAKTQSPQSGVLAEAFLRHMKHQDLNLPNTLCYNIAIKAWTSQRFRGREAAEHADRILEEMKGVDCEFFRPDIVSFGCKS